MQRHAIAQRLKAAYQPALHRLPVSFVEILAAKLMVGDTLGEERRDDDEEAVRHSDRGALSAPACGEQRALTGLHPQRAWS